MASVKLSEKGLLEQLQLRLESLNNKRLSQQDLLDLCIRFANTNFELFIQQEIDSPPVTPEKIQQIKKHIINTNYAFPEKTDDELIYDSE
jgi:hypothetical protein